MNKCLTKILCCRFVCRRSFHWLNVCCRWRGAVHRTAIAIAHVHSFAAERVKTKYSFIFSVVFCCSSMFYKWMCACVCFAWDCGYTMTKQNKYPSLADTFAARLSRVGRIALVGCVGTGTSYQRKWHLWHFIKHVNVMWYGVMEKKKGWSWTSSTATWIANSSGNGHTHADRHRTA